MPPTLDDELEQIAANLEQAAHEHCGPGTTAEPEDVLHRAASDIRVLLDNRGTGLVLGFNEEQLQDLRDGETVEVVLEEDGDRTDLLQVVWKTRIDAGDGAERFMDELNSTGDTDG